MHISIFISVFNLLVLFQLHSIDFTTLLFAAILLLS